MDVSNTGTDDLEYDITVVYSQTADAIHNPNMIKGDIVEEGDTVCIIEAMKVMNEIKAPFKCKVLESLIKEKEAVEPRQDLFVVEKL